MSFKMTKLDTASSEKWEQKKQCNVLKKRSDLPFISTVCHLVSTKYTSIKKKHPCLKFMYTVMEKKGKTINEVPISSAQPVLTTLEPQSATRKCKDLDSAQEKLPMLCETTEKVVSDAKNLMLSSEVKEVNDAVAGTIIAVVGPTKHTIQASLGTTQSAIINAFAEEHGVAPAQQQDLHGHYRAHLGTGMTQFQLYAYQHFHSMVRGACQSIWEALQTSYLVLKSCIIALIHTVSQPLKAFYLILLSSIEHFPVSFQDKVQQCYHTIGMFHSSFSTLDSFQNLSRQFLSQIWEKVTKEEHVKGLLGYMVYSVPLGCYVAPFSAFKGRT